MMANGNHDHDENKAGNNDAALQYLVHMEINVQCDSWGDTSVMTLPWDFSEGGLNITYLDKGPSLYSLSSSSCQGDDHGDDNGDCTESLTDYGSPCLVTNGFAACVVPCLGGAAWKAIAVMTAGVIM